MDNDDHRSDQVIGTGSPDADLTSVDLGQIVAAALDTVTVACRVLAIIPDKTRDNNTHILFPAAPRILAEKDISKIDVLVAQGTHSAMSHAEKLAKIGANINGSITNLGEIYDHRWDDPNELVAIGELSAEQVSSLTGGLFTEAIPLAVNRLVGAGGYDLILIFGSTMPHEVAGFAGGSKYFFPGVAGADLTHKTHWLAALASVENIIGRIETPTRHLIEAAADHIVTPMVSFTSVVSRTEGDSPSIAPARKTLP